MKIIFSVGLIIPGLLGAFYLINQSNQRADAEYIWVEHTHRVIEAAGQLLSTIKDAETGQRGFLLTGDETYLKPYLDAYEQVIRTFDQLRQLTSDNDRQQQRLQRLHSLVDEKFKELRQTIEIRKNSGFDASLQIVTEGTGKQLMGEIRRIVKAVVSEEKGLLEQRRNSSIQANAHLRRLLLWSSIALIGLILILTLVVLRNAVGPIRALRVKAGKIASGDYSARIRVKSGDEIGELAAAFNQMAQTVAENRQRSEGVINNMVDGVIAINEEGIVEVFNPAAEGIFGYRAEEVIGHNIKMLMPQPYRREHDGYLKHYLDTGEAKIIGIGRTVEGLRRDGSTFPMDLAVNEMPAGETRRFIGVVRDITERVQAEEAIAANSREIALRNRYEASYGKIVALFSQSFDRQEMLDGTLDILARQHPFPASAIYLYDEWSGQLSLTADRGIPGTLPQSFKLGEGIVGQAAKDGQTVVLDAMEGAAILSIETGLLSFAPSTVMAVPVYFKDKPQAVLIVASSKPLIELDQGFLERLAKQLGVALNNLNQHQALTELAEQLQTKSDEIRNQNIRLEQADRMKSEFLANMSHELRTPLNAIIGFSEVLKDGIIGELEAEQKDYVNDIFTSGKHLLSLINDILDLSKVEAGKMELELEPVNVTDMLRNAVSIIKEKAAAHRIQLDCDLAAVSDLDACYLDGRKVKQVVYNLLSNAVKFTPDEGRVSIRADKVSGADLSQQREGYPAPLTLPASLDGDFLEISVTDTGIGISDEDKKRLFTPFQQLESTLTKTYEGTGLGLVMVKGLAELHGGTVGVASRPGEGSTFVIWLPYVESEEQAQATTVRALDNKQAMTGATAHHHTVLMVEDDEKAAQLMRVQLEDAGYVVRHAISAEQALEMLSDELPDLITLDIMLPGMDGWELLQRFKQRPDTVAIPVVVVSIVADSEKGFALGAADVLQKPVQRQVLLDALGKLDFSVEGKRVLVVDDDPKAVELVSRHLSTAGCQVLQAYGGQEAIELALREQPDLIILDLMMPKVSGFDVVERLGKEPQLAATPIIILTAKVITDADRNRLNGDISKIMQKSSFNHGTFINEVNRAVHKISKG